VSPLVAAVRIDPSRQRAMCERVAPTTDVDNDWAWGLRRRRP